MSPNSLRGDYKTKPRVSQLLASSAWFQATRLSELATSLAENTLPERETPSDIAHLARMRLKAWQNQPPFQNAQLFQRRLALVGIDAHTLERLLCESAEGIAARVACADSVLVDADESSQLDWLRQLRAAYSCAANLDAPEHDATSRDLGSFLNLVRPLIVRGYDRLRTSLNHLQSRYPDSLLDRDSLEDCLLGQLSDRLTAMLSPTLVLELNVARIEERLTGDTPAERFTDFLRGLLDPDVAVSILSEYPVLARLVVEEIDLWHRVSVELIERLLADWPVLSEMLYDGQPLGVLTNILGLGGDRHGGGRRVAVLEFDTGCRIVYKPRALAIDQHFQELLQWFNQRSQLPSLQTVRIVERGAYGWMEYIATGQCQHEQEVKRFYQRHGALVAILYLLSANDIHSENVIASGEQPVIIDLETLFQPLPVATSQDPLQTMYHETLERSVLKSNLLPRLVWSESGGGLDISGIGGHGGQTTPDPARGWQDFATDQMRIIRQSGQLQEDQNRPVLEDRPVDAALYIEEIAHGFDQAYEVLMMHRHELGADSGPLATFKRDMMRVVMRNTRTYALLLRESYHPDLLRSALLRDRHFDRLWARVGAQPDFERLVPIEIDDLLNGDIPLFRAAVNGCSLHSWNDRSLGQWWSHSGWAEVQMRLAQLSATDKRRQLDLLRGALSQLTHNSTAHGQLARTQFVGPHRETTGRSNTSSDAWSVSHDCVQAAASTWQPAKRSQWLELADRVAHRLVEDSIGDGRRAIWIGLVPQGRGWRQSPTGLDLYSGLPGISLFLAHAGQLLNQPKYTRASQAALQTILETLDSSSPGVQGIGLFSGWGGILYSLAHLGHLWSQPALWNRAERIVDSINDLIQNDTQLDVIAGVAGCLAGSRALLTCRPVHSIQETIDRCGQRLLDTAIQSGESCGWIVPDTAPQPLTGFSHGAAGFAWSLEQAYLATGDHRFVRAAQAAVMYERQKFDQLDRNWLDLRTHSTAGGTERTCAMTWCHGAPGIGLARLNMHHLRQVDSHIDEEIDLAVSATLNSPWGNNHSLCHGDLGNLELIFQAGCESRWAGVQPQLQEIVDRITQHASDHGWRCGIPQAQQVSIPGMMTGLAGIGYAWLRLAHSECVPSILSLDPPRT